MQPSSVLHSGTRYRNFKYRPNPPQVQSQCVPVNLRVSLTALRSWFTYRRTPTSPSALTVGNIRHGRCLSVTHRHTVYNHHYLPYEFLVRLISFQGLCPELLRPSLIRVSGFSFFVLHVLLQSSSK